MKWRDEIWECNSGVGEIPAVMLTVGNSFSFSFVLLLFLISLLW
jgi:hypothetical protein